MSQLGVCDITRHDPNDDHDSMWITIERSDPEIMADQHVLDLIEAGDPGYPFVQIDGDLLKIVGDNRTVIYRIMEPVVEDFGEFTRMSRMLRWPGLTERSVHAGPIRQASSERRDPHLVRALL